MTQMGPTDQYTADLFFPTRHAHLSLYQVLSRQSMCIFMFSTYLIFSNNYCHPVIICDIYNYLFRIFAFFISHYMHE